MDMRIKKHGDNLIVYLHGELDHHSADHFRNKLDKEIAKGIFSKLILDMTHLNFMDSSGIGVILGRFNKIKEYNGQVILCGMNKQVAKIAQLAGLKKVLWVYNSLNEIEENL